MTNDTQMHSTEMPLYQTNKRDSMIQTAARKRIHKQYTGGEWHRHRKERDEDNHEVNLAEKEEEQNEKFEKEIDIGDESTLRFPWLNPGSHATKLNAENKKGHRNWRTFFVWFNKLVPVIRSVCEICETNTERRQNQEEKDGSTEQQTQQIIEETRLAQNNTTMDQLETPKTPRTRHYKHTSTTPSTN